MPWGQGKEARHSIHSSKLSYGTKIYDKFTRQCHGIAHALTTVLLKIVHL